MLGYLEQVTRNIDAVEHAGERMEQLRAERRKLSARVRCARRKLSARRKEAAAKLAKRVETELAGLAMERAVFEIAVRPARCVGIRQGCRRVPGVAQPRRRAQAHR